MLPTPSYLYDDIILLSLCSVRYLSLCFMLITSYYKRQPISTLICHLSALSNYKMQSISVLKLQFVFSHNSHHFIHIAVTTRLTHDVLLTIFRFLYEYPAGERPYKCRHCPKSYASKSGFNSHHKKYHPALDRKPL